MDTADNASLPPDTEDLDDDDDTVEPLPIDLAGRPRVADGDGDQEAVVDMGVYEFPTDCPEDLDGSGAVDFADILLVLAAWGNAGGPEDLDGNGEVGFGDLLLLLAAWGPC